MTDDELHSLAGAYAVDAVDDVERSRFESHLSVCAECRSELASLRYAAVALSELVSVGPPPALRAAVLARIASVRPLAPPGATGRRRDMPGPDPEQQTSAPAAPAQPGRPERANRDAAVVDLAERRRRRIRAWASGLVAAAVLGVVGLVWQPWDTTGSLSQTEQVLQAADAQRFSGQLAGGGSATFVRSPSLSRAVVVADALPSLAAGKVYQLWLKTEDGAFASAGLLPQTTSGRVTYALSGDASTAQGAGITVEPAGGSAQPTTTPLVLLPFA